MKKKIWILTLLLAVPVLWLLWRSLSFERLGQPLWLFLGLLLLPAVALAWWGRQREAQRLQRLFEHPLLGRMQVQAFPRTPLLRNGLWLLMLAALTVALARPQGPPMQTQIEAQGIDILVAFDISTSMQAADEYPNRLEAAKQALREFLPQLTGDRVGILVFSGEAFPLAPFTSDYAALSMLIDEVKPGLLPSATTDLEEALNTARERFQQRDKANQSGQVLVLFSDGENQLGDYDKAAQALTQDGTLIYAVGTGSKQGARIPERTAWGGLGYKTWQGQEVVTKLEERSLKKIAKAGQYLHIKDIASLPRLLERDRGKLQTQVTTSTGARQYQERYQAWLLLVLVLLALERSLWLWAQKLPRWQPRLRQGPFARLLQQILRQPRPAVLLFLPLLLGAWSWPWEGFWHNQQGQRAYEAQEYERAQQHFEQGLQAQPADPSLMYNQGNSQYRAGNYDQALESYRQSAESPLATPETQSQALFNLGNTYFRKGQQAPEQAQENWQEAIKAYEGALERNRQDTQALENLNHVQEQLQYLQQQPPQNQQEQSEQQGDSDPQNPGQDQNPGEQDSGQGDAQNPGPQDGEQPPSGQGQPQPNHKAPTSPLDGMFSDQEIENYLDQLKQQEQQDRDRGFQRNPRRQDPNDPMSEMDRWLNDSTIKDW